MSILTTITQSTTTVTKNLSKFLSVNSPTIKTIFGMVGVGVTAVETGKATWKTRDILDKMQGADTLVKIQKLAPVWITPIASIGVTEGLIFSANKENAKRIATLAAGYAAAEAKNRDAELYKEKVKEVFGEKKEAEIDKKVYEEKVAANPPVEGVNITETGNGNTIIQDVTFTGNYIRTSLPELERIINKYNIDILDPESDVEYSVKEVLEGLGFITPSDEGADLLNKYGYSKTATGKIEYDTIPVPHPTIEGEFVTGLELKNSALYFDDAWPSPEVEKYQRMFATI